MGIGKAKELIFTAKVIQGQEAYDIGLVEHVVPQNEDSNAAYLKALEIAKDILDKVSTDYLRIVCLIVAVLFTLLWFNLLLL